MNAVDTNVFVYLHDANEPAKQSQSIDLLDRLIQQPAETLLLWQVAVELLSCLRRWESAGKISRSDAEANFRDVLAMFPLAFPSMEVLEVSPDMNTKYNLSHWDGLIVAACKVNGVSTLYSEDLDAGTNYEGVSVVNPYT